MLISLLLIMSILGDEPKTYGAALKEETPLVKIEELMNNPQAYLGKVVKVEGKVREVCPKAGCWLDVVEGDHKVRIKVKDGEMVFERKLVGRKVLAEGTVYKFELTREQAVSYFRHLAEEKGEAFDPTSVSSATTIYQIGGLGVAVNGNSLILRSWSMAIARPLDGSMMR